MKVGILGEPVEVAIAEAQSLFQRERGAVKLLGERIAAREIVKDERVARLQARETFIHLESLGVTTALRVVIAQQLERIRVIGIAADKSLDEFDFDVQVTLLGARHLFSGTAFKRHTTR